MRTVVLEGARISRPPFYVEAVELASGSFPDLVHLASVTYVDITVFNERIEPTTDFHGLVHAQQFAELGKNGYAFRLKYKRANRGNGFDFSTWAVFGTRSTTMDAPRSLRIAISSILTVARQ